MSSIRSLLSNAFSQAFTSLGHEGRFGHVVESQRPDLCQFQCNGALAVAKAAKKNPREVAQHIVDSLSDNPMIGALSIAGPGFINVTLKDDFLAEHENSLLADERCGIDKATSPANTVIDFGGPNVAKPMHVGHLRSTIIGDSLQRLFRFLGHSVVSDNHVGDWGTQMGMLICELRRRRPELPYFEATSSGPYPAASPVSIADLEEMYPLASKRCKEHELDMAEALAATVDLQRGRPGFVALWKHFVAISVAYLKHDFEGLGVRFDHWLGESSYQERMESLVKRLTALGVAVHSEGATIIQVSRETDAKEIPPLLLVKSDGAFLYGTSDLATLEYRIQEFKAQRVVYVVDKRQSLHFEQVFRAAAIARLLPRDAVCVHAGFGTVNGPDGKPFKTRAGGVMKLSDLRELVKQKAYEKMVEAGVAAELPEPERLDVAQKVGIAALKFADLSNHRLSDYIFDIDKFTQFEGKTGPYLLYTAVRIKSILRKTQDQGLTGGTLLSPGNAERGLYLVLGSLPDAVTSAAEGFAPNTLCDWAFALAQEFNRFYRDCHVLREPDPAKQASWISLISLTLRELELVLGLLGMDIPDKM